MRGLVAALLFGAALPLTALAQGSAGDGHGARGAADQSFESVWLAALRAAQNGDSQRNADLLQLLVRLRVERNVEGLDSVALAAVERGLEALKQGQFDEATRDFSLSAALDPHLPEGQLGLALTRLRQGPLHYVGALRALVAAYLAPLPTADGRARLLAVGTGSLFAAALVASLVFGLCMILRYGVLVRHDIEEWLGSDTRRPLALGIYVFLLLLPLIALQGFAWLPLWWLALLFLHMRSVERALVFVLVAGLVVAGPLLALGQDSLAAWRNPLFRAALATVENSGDAVVMAQLDRARQENPDDRDLAYLLAAQYRKAGRYDLAAGVYRQILSGSPQDGVALNNLGNLDFANADYQAAIARYGAALGSTENSQVRATLFYNKHLAHLQKFEYQENQEARAQAERIDRPLIQSYERHWRVERDGSAIPAVVDLGLTPSECIAKFFGTARGVRLKNVLLQEPALIDGVALLAHQKRQEGLPRSIKSLKHPRSKSVR